MKTLAAFVGRRIGNSRYSFSTDTSVALLIAKTLSLCLRYIRLTEAVAIIDVTYVGSRIVLQSKGAIM